MPFCRCFYPRCLYCNIREQIHLWHVASTGGKPKNGYSYSHIVLIAVPPQPLPLFNLLSFRNGLTLCCGQADTLHSCSASIRVDGAAVRTSAY